jgi:hypothetical protein
VCAGEVLLGDDQIDVGTGTEPEVTAERTKCVLEKNREHS